MAYCSSQHAGRDIVSGAAGDAGTWKYGVRYGRMEERRKWERERERDREREE